MPANVLESGPSTTTTAVTAQASKPYVGARPFERWERGIFFGRDLEARRLRDKILTSRLTLFYAPSGVGKSSLLKTSVIPYLEQEDARVIYLDQWAMENPCETVRAALIQVALQQGVSDPAAGEPTLAELGLRIAEVDERPLVLIFDQFEAFMIEHGHAPEPLRKELGGLVRASKLDAHVVLSVRQEFLAALEPLRAEIMNLFQSTDVLESLDDEGVREAIQRPAALFGLEYEPALLDRLLKDLRVEQAPATAAVSKEAAVSLTMMQLVCDQLWKIAAPSGEKIITAALYDELGGAHKILESYIRGVMPDHWRDRYFTARLMKYLAPSSGYKKPYSPDELADDEHLKKARVNTELKRLSAVGVLRQRDFRGQQLFELQHDSLIKFIGPWREKVLRRARNWKRIGSVAVLVVMAFASAFVAKRLEQYRMTTTLLKDLGTIRASMPVEEWQRAAESRFDSATIYLLERERFNDLRVMLTRFEKDLPADYGFENLEPPQTAISNENRGCEFLCLHYSSLRPFDSRYFNYQWQSVASRVSAEKLGIPVPLRLSLIKEETLPKPIIRLTERLDPRVQFRMPPIAENEVFITSETFNVGQGSRLRRFLTYLLDRKAAREIDTANIIGESKASHSLWAVPSWSRPVWKASGAPALNGSGLAALLLAWKLEQNFEPLFTDEAVTLLLDRARRANPDTVREAETVRGGNLKKDLAEIIKQGGALTDIVAILDALSAYPESTPQEVAKKIDEDLKRDESNLAPKFSDRRFAAPSQVMNNEAVPTRVPTAYQAIVSSLPPVGKPIEVTLGANLGSLWVDREKDALNPELSERLQALREEFFRRFGIRMPEIFFRVASETDPLSKTAFRIEDVSQHRAEVVDAQPTTALDRLMDRVRSLAERGRIHWLLAEHVAEERQRLARTNPGLKAWLTSKYSIAEQKELMRAVVGPPVGEKSASPSPEVSEQETLRHEDWLLGSLVFWAKTSDARNGRDMAQDLRRTQSARLKRPALDQESLSLAPTVVQGIRELQDGQISRAEGIFAQAIRTSRPAAEKAFLSAYADNLMTPELRSFSKLCWKPDTRGITYSWAEDLEEDLKAPNAGLSSQEDVTLRLCLLVAYQERPRTKKVDIEGEILRRHPDPAQWDPSMARVFAEKVLGDIDPYADSSQLQEGAATLLVAAVQHLSPEDARTAFDAALKGLDRPGLKDVKLRLLKGLASGQSDPTVQIVLAEVLANNEREQDLNQAIEIVNRVKEEFARMPDSPQRSAILDLSDFVRGAALRRLSLVGVDRLAEVEAVLKKLEESPYVGKDAENEMADLVLDRGAYKEAIGLAQTALERVPESEQLGSAQLRLDLLLAQLLLGQKSEAGVEVQKTFEITQKTAAHINNGPLFLDYLQQYVSAKRAGNQGRAATIERKIRGLDVSERFKTDFKRLSSATDGKAFDRVRKEMEDWEKQQQEQYPALLLTAALGQMLTNREDSEETARRFLETNHPYVPYIAMILSARMADPAQAKEVLTARWKKADPKHWQQRLRGGDETAWREMLIGYYLGEVKRDQIFGQLEDEKAYANSHLRFVPLARQSLLCEAYFYDALLSQSKGDKAHRREYLQKALNTKVKSYIEYKLAKIMLSEGTQP